MSSQAGGPDPRTRRLSVPPRDLLTTPGFRRTSVSPTLVSGRRVFLNGTFRARGPSASGCRAARPTPPRGEAERGGEHVRSGRWVRYYRRHQATAEPKMSARMQKAVDEAPALEKIEAKFAEEGLSPHVWGDEPNYEYGSALPRQPQGALLRLRQHRVPHERRRLPARTRQPARRGAGHGPCRDGRTRRGAVHGGGEVTRPFAACQRARPSGSALSSLVLLNADR